WNRSPAAWRRSGTDAAFSPVLQAAGASRIDLAAGGGPVEVDGAADPAAQRAFQRGAALLRPDQLEVPLPAPVHDRVAAEELEPPEQARSRLDGHVVAVPFGAVLGGIA